DYVTKPECSREFATSISFRRELVDKIRALGSRRNRRPVRARVAVPDQAAVRTRRHPGEADVAAPAAPTDPEPPPFALRPLPSRPPRVLLVGSSTGGPQALNAMLAAIGPVIDRVPVLIAQHMPATFTSILAEHLARSSRRPAREATDGDVVCSGCV